MLPELVLAALLGSPLEVGVEPVSELDAGAVRTGIELRLGARSEDWQIRITSLDLDRVRAQLVSPRGDVLVRELTLTGQTPEDRSRELAATLALVMEDEQEASTSSDVPAAAPAPEPEPSRRTYGWLGLTGNVSLGRSIDLAAGAGLRGGVWLLGEHLQPIGELDWLHSGRGSLRVDGVRFGAGLAGGAPLARGRVWLGGAAVARGIWTLARAESRADAWASSTFLGVVTQLRVRWLVVGARVGLDLTLPPLHFQGNRDDLRWGIARLAADVSVGMVIPPRNR